MNLIQKELKNLMTLYYLIKLDKKIPTDNKAIKRRQNRRVHKMMKVAYKHPFYRKRFEENNLTPDDFHCAEDLVKFPILDRTELRLWMQKELEDNPGKRDNWEIFSTSGSSGIPLKFMLTHREAACMNANWIRVTMFTGYKPFTEKMITFLTTHSKVDIKKGDSFIQKLGLLRRKIVPEHLYVGEGMRDLIELVNEYKPDMICFRKNVLVRMAIYARNHGMKIHQPKAYTPVSEMVDKITRKLLTDTFGPNLFDAYGCNETGSCAVKLPGSDLFYVYNDTHVLNLVDDEGNLTDDGRLIGTTLYKKDFPIINYEIGDTANSIMKDGVRYIKTIKGRTNDLVQHADGAETSATELMKIPNGIVGISQFRYIQESIDEISILLVKDPLNDQYSEKEIEAFFEKKVEELYGYPEYKLTFKWMDEIPPDENGKMRCFISRIPKER
jgi:phenylacetate-CoA ligase